MRYVTQDEMREIDAYAIKELGIPAERLMENAGRAVASEALKFGGDKYALIFSGYGNNGGDGFVAARCLIENGWHVEVVLAGTPKDLSPESGKHYHALLGLNVKPRSISSKDALEALLAGSGKSSVIIDAIFGIGIKRSLDGFYRYLIENINALGIPIISVDIPSGLSADTGEPLPVAIKADVTVTMGFPKVGFRSPHAEQYLGKVVVADIGLAAPGGSDVGKNGLFQKKIIRLRQGRNGKVSPQHPWIHRRQVLKPDSSIKAGDIVDITSSEGRFIGRGYYNPRSDISSRILTFKDEAIDASFFSRRVCAAVEKRKKMLTVTNAYRAVFSESDGLPGLIVDVYSDTVVFQILTLGMEKFKDMIVGSIKDILKPRFIYEKSESPFRKVEGLPDVGQWWGSPGDHTVEIFEGKARFLVDIVRGHKTGFYLDQRRSRMAMEGISENKKVLDLFCYTGAFSVTSCLFGAKDVLGVDIKEEWLKLAEDNAKLNGSSDKIRFMKGDSFSALKKFISSGERFDIIIVDPPSFLKNRFSIASASKGYKELNVLAMRSLSEGGILMTFSCSHNMPNDIFSGILKEAARISGKKYTILKRCHQAEDHPIVKAVPETEYLKGYFLKINSQ